MYYIYKKKLFWTSKFERPSSVELRETKEKREQNKKRLKSTEPSSRRV